MQIQESKASKYIPLLVLVICLIPSVAANFLYKFKHDSLKAGETKQQGMLISPAIELPDINIFSDNGTIIKRDNIVNKWNIIYIKPEQCSSECKQKIAELKNLKVALGRDYNKINITTTSPLKSDNINLNEDNIYLIDPQTFVMMRYTQEHSTSQILKDVKHIMRYTYVK